MKIQNVNRRFYSLIVPKAMRRYEIRPQVSLYQLLLNFLSDISENIAKAFYKRFISFYTKMTLESQFPSNLKASKLCNQRKKLPQ